MSKHIGVIPHLDPRLFVVGVLVLVAAALIATLLGFLAIAMLTVRDRRRAR